MTSDATENEEEIAVDEETDDESALVKYHIATYPSDLNLSVLLDMWKDDEIQIPPFQRSFVWRIQQSSLLIESFLLGLPVPQAFFHVDEENKNWIIDGQQRILSVIFFFEGYFGFENVQGRRQVFRLTGLDEDSPYHKKRFEDLSQSDQRKLKQSVLRIVNIKQLSPSNDDTSIFHIFERLNTGGTPLKPQEIRNCVFHGPIVERLHELNENKLWRKVIGKPRLDKHKRDVEMILRIFAMTYDHSEYDKPMKEFLNKRMRRSQHDKTGKLKSFEKTFEAVLEAISKELPERPFNVRGPINLAAMDSIMSVLIRNHGKIPKNLDKRYEDLIADEDYREAIFFNTSDASFVEKRLSLAEKYLIK
ncbi:MAG: DUF262 domain-containing protein [Alphaproteobacteria bacterium]|nr:DUF262 domain-containing protein [Alphaproteobacteria bacterium]